MAEKDIVSKDVLQHLAADIANILLHLDVEHDSVELLQTEQQRIEVRRADMVARMRKRQTGEQFILHVEIQNANDMSMPVRMLRYVSDILLLHPNEPIYQYLVYIGKARLSMPTELVLPDFHYRYRVLDMHTVDCSLLLAQDTPEVLVLAILCDFKARPTQEVVNYIVKRLKELMGDNEAQFRNYYEMLETLADNRDLQTQLDEAKHMLTQVDVTRFSTYRWGLQAGLEQGFEQGREQGRELGLEQGREEGLQLKAIEMAKKLIRKGAFEVLEIAELTGLTESEIQKIKETMLN